MIDVMPMDSVGEVTRRNARVRYINAIGFNVMDIMHEFGDNNCILNYVPTDHRAEFFEIPRYSITVYTDHPKHGTKIVVRDRDNLGLATRLTAELRTRAEEPYVLEERFDE